MLNDESHAPGHTEEVAYEALVHPRVCGACFGSLMLTADSVGVWVPGVTTRWAMGEHRWRRAGQALVAIPFPGGLQRAVLLNLLLQDSHWCCVS